ncbi:alpha/beta fold hydrolase [Paraburkholderia sp. GAS334]|uniref:alpha/beta fold hydrolase n=1 Tax=Paraburkholderia sp. GAS334 TaxID=3035131 RepID=UPI003D1CBD25
MCKPQWKHDCPDAATIPFAILSNRSTQETNMNHTSRLHNFAKRGALVGATALALALPSLPSVAAAPAHQGGKHSEQTAVTATTRFVEANGIRFAYRRFGKPGKLPLVFNQHFSGNLDNWDPAVLDGLAKEREIIIFDNAGIGASTGEVPNTFAGMAKNAEAFIDALGLKKVDLLGFSIGGMVAQQITLDRPELIDTLILVGSAPRNMDAGDGKGHVTPETSAVFGAQYNPPENMWLKVFFTDSEKSQAAGREFLKRYASRTKNRDLPPNEEVVPAQVAAIAEWGDQPGERFAYLKDIKQPTLVVSGTHDVIVYTVNSLYLAQNLPNAKLVLYPDANHGSWYQYHNEFVAEANRFLD